MSMSPRLLRPRETGFNPKSISGLVNWFDASDRSTITLNGTTVSVWANKGSGPSLTQETASAQPTYSLAGVNGRNVLTFDGGDVLSATSGYNNAAMTVFVVAREDAEVNFAGLLSFYPSSGSDNGNANSFLIEAQTSTVYARVDRGSSAAADSTGSGAFPLSVFAVTGSATTVSIRRNGVLGQASSNTTTGTTAGILVGGRFQSGAISALYRARITLCEIVHYTSVLSASDISKTEKWLGTKWGVVVA